MYFELHFRGEDIKISNIISLDTYITCNHLKVGKVYNKEGGSQLRTKSFTSWMEDLCQNIIFTFSRVVLMEHFLSKEVLC